MAALLLSRLRSFSLAEVAVFFLLANALIFGASVFFCWLIGRLYSDRRLFQEAEPLRSPEIALALLAVVLNTGVSVAGWELFRRGLIEITTPGPLRSAFDTLVMVLAMDLGMYALHRAAHHPRLYSLFHHLHHRHASTNPFSLFVLHPLEVLGFGGLMIAFLWIYPMSFWGLGAYLALNVLFGTVGHAGVEPFPAGWRRWPLLRWVGTSTFHGEHHASQASNFGFYTLLWDALFGTLREDYFEHFEAAARGQGAPGEGA